MLPTFTHNDPRPRCPACEVPLTHPITKDRNSCTLCLICGHIYFVTDDYGTRNLTREEKKVMRNRRKKCELKQWQDRVVERMVG